MDSNQALIVIDSSDSEADVPPLADSSDSQAEMVEGDRKRLKVSASVKKESSFS